jgi:hypothetical protein
MGGVIDRAQNRRRWFGGARTCRAASTRHQLRQGLAVGFLLFSASRTSRFRVQRLVEGDETGHTLDCSLGRSWLLASALIC